MRFRLPRFLRTRHQRQIAAMEITFGSQLYVIKRLRTQLTAHHENLDRFQHRHCPVCHCMLMKPKQEKTSAD